MSSHAVVSICGYELYATQNHYFEWHFKKADRKIERQRYFYEIPASKLCKRLELSGTNLAAAKREFEISIKNRIALIENFESDAENEYLQADLSALNSANFDKWSDKLKQIVESGLVKTDEYTDPTDHNCPILNILLRTPCYQRFTGDFFCEESDVLPINWPCSTIDAFARTLVEKLDKDAPCVLDVTDLVDGGWTNEFSDLEEYQARCTSLFEFFENAISDIESLLTLAEGNQTLLRLLYANSITAMETYLGDTIRKQVLSRPAIMRRFVETNSDLRDKKIPIADLFNAHDAIKQTVAEILERTVFHQLDRVIGLYKNVLGVDFPAQRLGVLRAAVEVRHDIIHRNGKTLSGKTVDVTTKDILDLLKTILEIITAVDQQVQDGLLDEVEMDEEHDTSTNT